MDILSVLKGQASKPQQQLDTVNAAIKLLGGKKQRCSSQETASLRKCTRKDVEGTKGAVGEDQSREEECLDQASPTHGNGFAVLVVSWRTKQRCASTTSW